MRFDTLQAWLDWQQTLNPRNIELGLDRTRRVFERLQLAPIAQTVITVAGTNGKGSTVAYYESWLKNAGYRVASYTSPHLLHYNERIRLDVNPVSDADLCRAFDAIDQARADIPLTYFEFGTLAALYLMAEFSTDVAILEVGLGGRLDAVNIIDADLAHLTPIGLDHQDWLGDTRELIGAEKAGILRTKALAVVNMQDAPDSVMLALRTLHCQAAQLDVDYHFKALDDGCIEWRNERRSITLKPPLAGVHQQLNIAGVLAGLDLLGFLQHKTDQQIINGFSDVQCPGRLQRLETAHRFELWIDVGHNVDAATALRQALKIMPADRKITVLLGMLADKDATAFTQVLADVADDWWLLSLQGERGQSTSTLARQLPKNLRVTRQFDDIETALQHAVSSLDNQDILLATGSFITVEAVLRSANFQDIEIFRT
jgi:dihydrofolate synthase/folylpolyglutamate synthase